MNDATQAAPRVATITVRQREVLDELMRDGASQQVIAHRLGISYDTVATHMRRLYRACDVGCREELIVGLFRGRIQVKVKYSGRAS